MQPTLFWQADPSLQPKSICMKNSVYPTVHFQLPCVIVCHRVRENNLACQITIVGSDHDDLSSFTQNKSTLISQLCSHLARKSTLMQMRGENGRQMAHQCTVSFKFCFHLLNGTMSVGTSHSAYQFWNAEPSPAPKSGGLAANEDQYLASRSYTEMHRGVI